MQMYVGKWWDIKNNNLPEYALDILMKLMIEQEFEDKKKGKTTYVKKAQAYRDLINLIKEVWGDEIQ